MAREEERRNQPWSKSNRKKKVLHLEIRNFTVIVHRTNKLSRGKYTTYFDPTASMPIWQGASEPATTEDEAVPHPRTEKE